MLNIGTDAGVLHALDARDGRERWRVKFDATLRAAATVFGTRLFVVSDDGVLTCLARQWSRIVVEAGRRRASQTPRTR